MLQAWQIHLYLGSFFDSSLQILSSFVRLDGKCRCTAIFRSLQRCSISYLGCVLRVIVLLEGEPSSQSDVLSRISTTISLFFALFIFPSILTSLPVPAAEKHPHSMMLLPPCFRPKSSILVSSDQIILFLMIWESLGAFWQPPSRLSCAFYCGVVSVWPLP